MVSVMAIQACFIPPPPPYWPSEDSRRLRTSWMTGDMCTAWLIC